MRLARAIVVGIVLASVLTLAGCKKKKPPLPPPQAQAPTITQPASESQAPAPTASEPNRPEPATSVPEVAAPAPPPTPAPKPKPKPRRAKKTSPEKPAEKQPTRTVVEEGGAPPAIPRLSDSLPHDTAIHQKLNTAQLLETADYNLRNLNRALNADEQAMVQHIRSYMQQSRDATRDGDTERAYNLALKARLLSDELVKR